MKQLTAKAFRRMAASKGVVNRATAKFERIAAINSMPANERPGAARKQLIAYETDGRSRRERDGKVNLGSLWNPNNKRFAR